MTVVELNAENWKEHVNDGVTIVDFWAAWCAPCKQLAPIYNELASEYKGKAKFAKIHIDDHPEIAEEFSVSGIPCLVVMKDGIEFDRIVGLLSKQNLKAEIDGIIGRALG
jgi:thioredoxin 1